MSEERLNRIETLLVTLSDTINQKFKVYDSRFNNIEVRLKTIELDVEPDGRISEAFGRLSDEIDSFKEETNKRLDRLEHGQNQITASLDVILRHITGLGQEPPQN